LKNSLESRLLSIFVTICELCHHHRIRMLLQARVYTPQRCIPPAACFRHANGCYQRSQRLRRLFVKCAHITYSMNQATLKRVDHSQHGYKIARSRRQC
jgi:hypothetical protein